MISPRDGLGSGRYRKFFRRRRRRPPKMCMFVLRETFFLHDWSEIERSRCDTTAILIIQPLHIFLDSPKKWGRFLVRVSPHKLLKGVGPRLRPWPWSMGPGPWALAHGPWPIGPGPGPGPWALPMALAHWPIGPMGPCGQWALAHVGFRLSI